MFPSPSSQLSIRLAALRQIAEAENRIRALRRERILEEHRRQLAVIDRVRSIREQLGTLKIDQLPDEDCLILFRFTYQQIKEMTRAFGFGEKIKIRAEDPSHAYDVDAVEVIAIMLKRLSFPARLIDLGFLFGRSQPEMSRIFRTIINILYHKYSKAMEVNLHQFSPANLRRFSEAIHSAGSPFPKCAGFIDGTFMHCARPVEDAIQRILYNGHYRGHGYKFQSVETPDGLTSCLWGPITGNRHDAQMYNESHLEDILRPLFDRREEEGCHYHLYGDQAYGQSAVMERPFSRVTATEEQKAINRNMSSVRVSVENGFAQTTSLFAYLDFARTLRSMGSPVTKDFVIATLLKNIHVCMNGGNQISRRFGVLPPTFQTYMNSLETHQQQ